MTRLLLGFFLMFTFGYIKGVQAETFVPASNPYI